MAKVSFIMALLIFQGCLFCHGSTITTYITPSPTTMVGGGVSSTTVGGEVNNTVLSGEVTTTLAGEGDVTTPGGAVTNTASVGVIATTTTGIGDRVTSAVGGGETSSAVNKSVVSPTSTPTGLPSSTPTGPLSTTPTTGPPSTTPTGPPSTTPTTGPPSSTPTVPPPCSYSADIRVDLGPVLLFSLKVTVDCFGGKLKVLIDNVIAGLLKISIKAGFIPCGVEVKSATCNSPFEGKFILSLHTGGPSGVTIEQLFKNELQQGAFGDYITANNTVYTLEFQGVDLKKTPKPGECDRVCCNGAGGEMLVEVTCTPVDKCRGIDLSDREEDGYCPGDSKAYCKCSKGLQDLPSIALIAALGLTPLMKSIF